MVKNEEPIVDIHGWYTAGNAAKALSRKSGREVKPAYVRSLARLNKVTTRKIDARTTLYLKADIDNYIVEERGAKVVRAQKARAKKEKTAA